jgi:hypothetical protein
MLCSTVSTTVLIVMANISNIPLILNLVSYLHGTMHMGVKDASTTSTNFFGAICFFSLLGAFISDSYVKRFYTILIFAPIEIMVRIYHLLIDRVPSPCIFLSIYLANVPFSHKHIEFWTSFWSKF